MDNIYDTLAKLNKVANAPEIVKEDSNALMKKGLEDLMKKTKFNKDADYKPFGKGDKDYEDGLSKDAKKDKMFEKESDVERDDRAEKAGREVKRDAKYDHYRHAGKDGKSVTKDIEYDEKHDKDGMHEADINEISNKTIDSYMDKVGQEDGHEQDMETASSKREKGIDLATAKQLGNAKVKATENAGTLKDAARQGVMARLAELAGIPAQEIEEALGTPQDIADKIMSEDPLDEADVEEGNEFSGERDKAIKAGKNDFTVDGKTYPVKGDKNESIDEDEEKLDEDGNKKQMQDVEEGMSKEEFEKEYPGQGSTYDKIKKELEEKMDEGAHDKEEKVEETTGSGAIADGAGAGKPLYKNASVYESNEIVKRAMQINEDMSVTVSAGTRCRAKH